MKYCSYCGSELTGSDVIFCSNCGKKLPTHEVGLTEPLTEELRPEPTPGKTEPENKTKKIAKPPKPKEKKPKKKSKTVVFEPADDGYDGYYEDVLPTDSDREREGLDKELIKKIVALAVGVVLIIGLCVVMMYLL